MQLILSAIPFLFGMISITSWADHPCAGKADHEVRLDQKGKSLENSNVLDQDSIGVCYATSAAVAIQSVLPGNPQISYLDYAVQFKRAENRSKASVKANGSVLNSGIVCDHFNEIKNKGFCPRAKVALENASSTDPEIQIQSLNALGAFFDLQKKATPEQRLKARDAIKKAISLAEEKSRLECLNFPVNARNVISSVYSKMKNDIAQMKKNNSRLLGSYEERLRQYNEKKALIDEKVKVVDGLKAKIQTLTDQYQEKIKKVDDKKEKIQGKLFPGMLKSRKTRLGLKLEEEIRPIKYEYLNLEIDVSMENLKLNPELFELEKIRGVMEKISTAERKLASLGNEVPDPESSVANATKIVLNSEIEDKLQTDFKNSMANHRYQELGFDQFSKMLKVFLKERGVDVSNSEIASIISGAESQLEDDFNQATPERCLAWHISKHREDYKKELSQDLSCISPKLVDPAVSMLAILNKRMKANMSIDQLFEDMDSKTFDFMESVIGSSCTDRDRIKPKSSLTCRNFDVFDFMVAQPEPWPASNEAVTRRVTDRFRKISKSNLDSGKAVLLGVCADMFYKVDADSSFGTDCRDGGHGVALVGYRCKSGKLNFLIQNSWGSSCGPYGDGAEQDHGRVWVQERLLIRNLFDVGMFQ